MKTPYRGDHEFSKQDFDLFERINALYDEGNYLRQIAADLESIIRRLFYVKNPTIDG